MVRLGLDLPATGRDVVAVRRAAHLSSGIALSCLDQGCRRGWEGQQGLEKVVSGLTRSGELLQAERSPYGGAEGQCRPLCKDYSTPGIPCGQGRCRLGLWEGSVGATGPSASSFNPVSIHT